MLRQITPFLIALALLSSCKKGTTTNSDKINESEEIADSIPVAEPKIEFAGIEYDAAAYEVDSSKIRTNQLFADLLKPYQIDYSTIQILVDKSASVFDLRKLQAGKWMTYMVRTNDSVEHLDYFIYHHSLKEKVVFNIKDSAYVYLFESPVATIQRKLSSRISKTLYHSILENNTSYELGIKLSEVFAWQVDFFKIDAHDHFKVIYDEYRVDGALYAVGNISSAEFFHRGDTFRAYYYLQDDVHTYFDDEGRSLRKAFLKAPLKYSRISSRYTKRRFHPVQRRWKAHLGTDYAAPRGTPIRSVGDGVVIAASYTGGNGNYVKVKHNATYTTQYLHMSRRAVRQGQRVTQGQVIGYVGSTGLATGPHLCFRFWMHGRQVDPFSVKIPPSTPITDEHKEEYFKKRDSLRHELDLLVLTQKPTHSVDSSETNTENSYPDL